MGAAALAGGGGSGGGMNAPHSGWTIDMPRAAAPAAPPPTPPDLAFACASFFARDAAVCFCILALPGMFVLLVVASAGWGLITVCAFRMCRSFQFQSI